MLAESIKPGEATKRGMGKTVPLNFCDMFGTAHIIDLSKELILSRIGEFELFKHYIKRFKQLSEKFSSELRQDKNPSCGVFKGTSCLLYKDFGTGEVYDIFGYLQVKYGYSFREVLMLIGRDYELYNGSFTPEQIRVLPTPQNEPKTEIKVKFKPFTGEDYAFWEAYGITSEILTFFNVKSISTHWLIKGKKVWKFDHSKFAYRYYFNNGIYKLYFPFNEENKWLSTKGDYVQGIYQLPQYGHRLVITSSYKDVMVLRRMGIYAVAPSSESQLLKDGVIDCLKRRFTEILIYYNNDRPGIRESIKQSKLYEVDYVLNPVNEPKDPSDLVKEYGIEKAHCMIKEVLMSKNDLLI